MIGFFIKKAFFDGWDNLIGIILFNAAYLAIGLAGLYAFFETGALGTEPGMVLAYGVIALSMLVFSGV